MIPIQEFLTLKAPVLDLKVINDWQHVADETFVQYVLQHHTEFDYQHLRCALRILQNVDNAEVRDLFRNYADHREPGYSILANGSLELQRKRGWCNEIAAAH